jgi:hypothetical protein
MGIERLCAPSVTVIIPVTPALSLGKYWSLIWQEAPGASEAVQVDATIVTWAEPVPLIVMVRGPVEVPP